MTKWQRKLLLNPEWDQAQDKKITAQELAKSVATKLLSLKPFKPEFERVNDERTELAEEFSDVAADPNATLDDFNYVMAALYDWGDQTLDGGWNGRKVCWIDHMSSVEVA